MLVIVLENRKLQKLAFLCLSTVAVSNISSDRLFACPSVYVSGSTERRRHIQEEAQIAGCKDGGGAPASMILDKLSLGYLWAQKIRGQSPCH